MRKFGSESIDYFEFQLEGSEEIFRIPKAASMPVGDVVAMREAQNKSGTDLFVYQVKMLAKYMGDAAYELNASTVSAILRAWASATEDQGASVGES